MHDNDWPSANALQTRHMPARHATIDCNRTDGKGVSFDSSGALSNRWCVVCEFGVYRAGDVFHDGARGVFHACSPVNRPRVEPLLL
jgi:hypothetical protein